MAQLAFGGYLTDELEAIERELGKPCYKCGGDGSYAGHTHERLWCNWCGGSGLEATWTDTALEDVYPQTSVTKPKPYESRR